MVYHLGFEGAPLALRWLSFGAQRRPRTRRGFNSPSAWEPLSYHRGVEGAPRALRWLPFGAQRRPRMRRGFHSPSAEGYPASHQIPISICMPPAPGAILRAGGNLCATALGLRVHLSRYAGYHLAHKPDLGRAEVLFLRARGNLCATALGLRVHLSRHVGCHLAHKPDLGRAEVLFLRARGNF